jgi:hypothetical protein
LKEAPQTGDLRIRHVEGSSALFAVLIEISFRRLITSCNIMAISAAALQ